MLKPRNIFSHNHIIFPKNHIVIPMFFLFYMFLPGGICLGDVQSKPKNTTPLIKNQGRCSFKRVYYRQHRCQVGWIHPLVIHSSTEKSKKHPRISKLICNTHPFCRPHTYQLHIYSK